MDEASRAREDLAMIRRMMEDARRVVHGGGGHLVLWGVLSVAALLVTFAAARTGWPDWAMWIWPVAIGVGWLGSALLGRRDHLRSPASTPAARMLGAIWIGIGVTATILGLVGGSRGGLVPGAIAGVMACVLGAGFFASGFVYGARWVAGLAVLWWVGGALMLIWPGAHTLLVLAGMLVLLQIVPGAVFLRRAGGASGRSER